MTALKIRSKGNVVEYVLYNEDWSFDDLIILSKDEDIDLYCKQRKQWECQK